MCLGVPEQENEISGIMKNFPHHRAAGVEEVLQQNANEVKLPRTVIPETWSSCKIRRES